ncbi:MAG: hypothetical protein IKT48_01505, partial [Anaerotignum sp.]|nr:hypothetical protein [Anaerotignum sp.]
ILKMEIKQNFIDVLVRAYPQCLLVMKEILCLLKNGYPDGALARSRRIYENMIIACYLNIHKADTDFSEVIERYFDDQNIRAYAGRKLYYRSVKQDSKADECNKAINKIIRKYVSGKGFADKRKEILSNNYWWAKNSKMSFAKLSECLDDEHAKVLYVRACYSIHAGAMGDVALLGRTKTEMQHLYSSATYNGASIPLQLAVYSLANITEVVFENLGVQSPVSSEEFLSLLHTYFKNASEEIKGQKNEDSCSK